MKDRVILHSDLNNFFASVETVLHPEYKGKPLIVCGDPKERRGVVFAKNYEAKAFGIKTADTVVSALKKCPNVIMCEPHFSEYNRYSKAVQEIYLRFTDKIDVCSIDECALDVTESVSLLGSGEEIAQKIRRTVKKETGLTVSIGVSFNRAYAKLASEFKKPDAVSVLSRENYRKIVYPMSAGELLYVGKSTEKLLQKHGIFTIGDIANSSEETLYNLLGKRAGLLRTYARGEDETPVGLYGTEEELKSIGNSMTLPKDTSDLDEIKRLFFVLAESVSQRLKEADVGKCDTVHIVVKDENLKEFTRQEKISPTTLCQDIARAAFGIFTKKFPLGYRVHLLGLSVSGFDNHVEQLTLDGVDKSKQEYEKRERAENAVAGIRKKYGYDKLQRGIVFEDDTLKGLDIKKRKE